MQAYVSITHNKPKLKNVLLSISAEDISCSDPTEDCISSLKEDPQLSAMTQMKLMAMIVMGKQAGDTAQW